MTEALRSSNIKKYGVSTPLQIRSNRVDGMFNKFGVEHPAQLPGQRCRLRNWCEENPGKLYVSNNELELLNYIQTYFLNARQKKVVSTPVGMTEAEHAKKDGLLRIYDCGKIRYKFKKT